MKIVFVFSLLVGGLAFAQDAQEAKPESQAVTETSTKMTTKDAKKLCKSEGKTGAELIKCLKEKKGEK